MRKKVTGRFCSLQVGVGTIFVTIIIIFHYWCEFNKFKPTTKNLDVNTHLSDDFLQLPNVKPTANNVKQIEKEIRNDPNGLKQLTINKITNTQQKNDNYNYNSTNSYNKNTDTQLNTGHKQIHCEQAMGLDEFPIDKYYHRKIITGSIMSQKYFDQAMILSFGFNHDEAIRSLNCAIRINPNCAMCHWAIAHNLGTNVNRRLTDKSRLDLAIKHTKIAQSIITKQTAISSKIHNHNANVAIDNAKHSSHNLSFLYEIEKGLIDAMAVRFPRTRSVTHDYTIYLERFAIQLANLILKYSNDADLYAFYSETIDYSEYKLNLLTNLKCY